MRAKKESELAQLFIDWVLSREIDGCEVESVANGARIVCDVATGYVSLYDIDDSVIVDMRLEQASDGETVFFLHFELEDLSRAKAVYLEMEEALDRLMNRQVRHILLCCTCGITTTFFANKLNETATGLGLDYDFRAMPIEEARKQGTIFAAILLAPQVGHRVEDVAKDVPGTLVIEIPGHLFGSYDAAGVLRLVVDALAEQEDVGHDTLKAVRQPSVDYRILAISHVRLEKRETILSYRVYDRGKMTLSGRISSQSLGIRPVVDLIESIKGAGWAAEEFDAIGICVSQRVFDGSVRVGESKTEKGLLVELSKELSEQLGTRVFVHSTGLAAAAGCYLTQDKYESIAFHAQPLGNPEPTQGYVIAGKPYDGLMGMSGQMGYLMRGLYLHRNPEDSSWHYAGVLELVTRYVAIIACTIAPEAVYVWCDLMPDLHTLDSELRKILPEDGVPKLIAVGDYEGYVLTGEMGLCIDELSQ